MFYSSIPKKPVEMFIPNHLWFYFLPKEGQMNTITGLWNLELSWKEQQCRCGDDAVFVDAVPTKIQYSRQMQMLLMLYKIPNVLYNVIGIAILNTNNK